MKTLRQITALLLTKPATLLVCCIISVLFCAMSFITIATAGTLWSHDHYEGTYERISDSLARDAYETAPQYLKNRIQDEHDALYQALSANDDAEYVAGISRYYDVLADEDAHGYLSLGDRQAFEANRSFISSLAQSEDPTVYAFLAEYPALLGTLYCLQRLVPFFVLLVPALFVSFDGAQLFQRGRLLNRAPISPVKRFFCMWLPSYVASLILVAGICLPMFLSCLIRNGLGSIGYPLVFVQSGVMMEMGVGDLWLRCIVLFLLANLFVVLLVSVLARLSGSAFVSTLLVAGLLALTVSPAYTASVPSWLLAVPMTYCDITAAAGRIAYGEATDISSVYGATWELGLIVLGIYCVVAGVVLLIIEKVGAPCVTEALASRVPHVGRRLHA